MTGCLRTKGSAEHSRCTCVNRPSRSADEQLHNNAPHKNCLRKKTTACVSLLVFFRITRGTFPYSVGDDASTTSLPPTTHYTNTCVKLTIVTHLPVSFSEGIAIANLSLNYNVYGEHNETRFGEKLNQGLKAVVKRKNPRTPAFQPFIKPV